MKEAKPGIDIVVVNYKSWTDMDRFLRSVVACRPECDYDVWIANVAPGDTDRVQGQWWLETHDWNHEVFEENVGFNIACNVVGSKGFHDVVALFNADVELTHGALDLMRDTLLAHPDWAIAGPRQMNERGQLVAAGIFGTDVKPQHRGWKATQGYNDVRDDCTVVCGSALFIKRSAWDELTECPVYAEMYPTAEGPILPVHHFYGDTALSYHARAHGHKLGYVGSTTIQHKLHGAGRSNVWTKADKADFRAFCAAHGIECE